MAGLTRLAERSGTNISHELRMAAEVAQRRTGRWDDEGIASKVNPNYLTRPTQPHHGGPDT